MEIKEFLDYKNIEEGYTITAQPKVFPRCFSFFCSKDPKYSQNPQFPPKMAKMTK